MLFSSIHLPVPTGPRYEPKKIRANDIYLYYRISSYRNNKGELKHNRKIIGKILHDDNVGMDYFVPNPTYYELHELPLPQEQPLKKAGPVSKGKKAVGAKATASDSIYVTTNYCEQNLPKNTDLGFFTADRIFFSSKFATLP